LFVALYALISALFMITTVLLPNYSSGNSIQPISACLAFFEAIWHFLQVVWHFLFTWTWQPWCKRANGAPAAAASFLHVTKFTCKPSFLMCKPDTVV